LNALRPEEAFVRIGILQTGHVPAELAGEFGEYPAMFEQLLAGNGFSFVTFAVVESVFPGSVTECDGWLITGSRHGAYEDHPWIPPLEDFIREAYAKSVPVAGICFGHQIMAQALGGKVEKYSGGWGAGHMRYRMKDGSEIELNAMHQDQVVTAPPQSETICTSEFCEFAGLAYGGRAISFQPHPEFGDEFTGKLIEGRVGKLIPESQAEEAMARMGKPTDSGRIATMLAEFFRQASARKAA
jgi:GMP synthase-like glutamine amidotransferase